MNRVVVVGGGAAGMMSAIIAARGGAHVTVIEKNEKLGKKLFITGKGRCNLTNICSEGELKDYIVSNPKFLYSAFNNFDNNDAITFFEELGLRTKVERGGRVFPASDKSSDVIKVLSNELKHLDAEIILNTEVKDLVIKDNIIKAVKTQNREIEADRLIITTGGKSYKSTGSTGDALHWANKYGIKVTKLSPSLVPMIVKETRIGELQGLSLKNVRTAYSRDGRELYNEFGEMLFTHYGVSGPLILTASSYLSNEIEKGEITLDIDLKPAITDKQLDGRLLREFEANKNKQLKSVMTSLLPGKMRDYVSSYGPVAGTRIINEITKEERRQIVEYLKRFRLHITGLRGFDEAIITRGGISIKEINPKTMESKKYSGLYFAGEVLDLDAVTGGYNLQIAWSTAYMAGKSASY